MLNIQSKVFSRIKNQNESALKAIYPNINFTTDNREPLDPSFPTVYVHERATKEYGQTIDGLEINAVKTSFQIDVTDNESMENAKYVMDKIVATMKSMRFSVSSMPTFDNDTSVYRQVATFERVIGSCDTL